MDNNNLSQSHSSRILVPSSSDTSSASKYQSDRYRERHANADMQMCRGVTGFYVHRVDRFDEFLFSFYREHVF